MPSEARFLFEHVPPFVPAGLLVQQILPSPDHLTIVVAPRQPWAACPTCAAPSWRVHSRYNRGLKVHHNRLDLTLDDALEPDGEVVDNQWHGNVVTRARCAARLKTLTMGPLYFYNNTLLDSLDGLRLPGAAGPWARRR